MVRLTINDQMVTVPEGMTILEAARKVGIEIPHLCFLKGINDIGACRVCIVEMQGMDKLITACNTPVEEGMILYTNSPRVRATRKTNVQLILSDHDGKCATCVRSGNCLLQSLANDLGVLELPYEEIAEHNRWDRNFPLIREASKCIKCMRCIQICDRIQDMQVWNVSGSGFRTTVDVTGNVPIKEASCALCGQCITHCPVGALRERDDVDRLFEALADPETVTMVQVAPAVRTAWGEGLGLSREESTTGKLISALRQVGFDYVFDTVYSADLTIMEEGSEFLKRFQDRDSYNWPMFTSCCPGWLRFVKSQYPHLVSNLSTAKSPQQMFGAVAKTYMAQKIGVDPEKIFCVSIMPCVSKKFECDVKQVNDSGYGKDVDLVLTTRELDRLVRADRIKAEALEEEAFDKFFGEGSGAGLIFGSSGGVMEAALRSAYFLLTKKNPKPDAFKRIRGEEGWRSATFEIEGVPINVAVVSGLGNTRKLLEALKRGEVCYDFVEIMACPGGCAGGGGQPIQEGMELAPERGTILYGMDRVAQPRFSHENNAVLLTYEEFLKEPMSERAHELLHTELAEWEIE
ncbi:[FeFe] hydrogenase, group A [Zhenpiania hominis]|uniref:(2Fe-2S)-binding protein n=1 Tax=Zhenpiania hominis TaxID=2763644 RepID=A0A923NJM2_9FIRM|nr:[FeFe] hydrogenase, group A [Zhenpiania hominis]MBC6679297.1 (2Fe-2S)-binding protein [Zhenpiania hominis]